MEELKDREEAVIIAVNGGAMFLRRMSSLNLREGKTVRKITSQPLRGPVIVEIDGRRYAIGKGMARKIVVRRVQE